MNNHICEECRTEFTSSQYHNDGDPDIGADVQEEIVCDTIDGQFTEFFVIRCPNCSGWVHIEWV